RQMAACRSRPAQLAHGSGLVCLLPTHPLLMVNQPCSDRNRSSQFDPIRKSSAIDFRKGHQYNFPHRLLHRPSFPMAEERAQRRLAAILAADVVGYSRLMERDEAGTLATLKNRRKDVLEPLVAQHQGRIFKVAGDGMLVEFGSAVNAVH